MIEPPWLREAKRHIGLAEIPGPRHNPTILGWAKRLGAKVLGITVTDDETPWCGTFAAHCIDAAGLSPPQIAVRAKAWADGWGRQLTGPRYGMIVVFDRRGGGHVGFYVGEDDEGMIHVLGGNQGNRVSVMRLPRRQLVAGGMRWPLGYPLPKARPVIVPATGQGPGALA